MATLSTGADSEGGERFGACEYNDIKNHWRMSDPCANLTDIQPGMIVSDEDDDRLYVASLVSGCPCSEILQACVPLSDDKALGFGTDWNAQAGYDELTNDALILGIPVDPERGVIICDLADVGVDFTGLITASAYPVFWFIDLNNDSYLGVGHQADDRPGIWSGAADSSILAIQYDANADVTIFENSEVGENRLVYIYGWDAGAGATRYGSLQITNSGSFELNAQEQGALAQGGTVVVRWTSSSVQWLDDKLAVFGSTDDASIEYDETLNDAWIFGIPCDGAKRGLIFCDNPAADMTFLPFRTLPTLTGPDPDLDSYWELGFWADDVGLLTIPANPLRENMLTNSGFGVWSQSDANKGIAELVFDNGTVAPVVGEAINGVSGTGKVMYYTLSGGGWGTNDAAGSVFLGAVTGAYEDNETIAGSVAASFDVNGDLDIGVKNDPMNDNSVALWTLDAQIALASVGALYTVQTIAAGNQNAWIPAAPLTAGKIYKIELDIKDGTVANRTVQGYFDDGAAQYGRSKTTAAGWVSVSWVFECATTTAAGLVGFRVVENMGGGGNNFEIRRFSCYEITPGCTAADMNACDTWAKDLTLDIYREHNDGGTNTKDGSFYSMKLVPSAISDYIYCVPFSSGLTQPEYSSRSFAGRVVTFGAWIKASTASHARLRLRQTSGYTDSPYHTGGGSFEWLEVTASIASNSIQLLPYLSLDVAPNVDGSTITYVSQPILVFGSSIGEGNYCQKQQEEIRLESYIPSNLLDGLTGQSNVAVTSLNLEADSDSCLPKGITFIYIQSDCQDAGSAGNPCYLRLRGDNSMGYYYYNSPEGLVNDASCLESNKQPCDSEGDIEYNIAASGGGTFDINYFRYYIVRVN